jgi:hypothetical protein
VDVLELKNEMTTPYSAPSVTMTMGVMPWEFAAQIDRRY